ncbi:MAG: hypothetical protein R2778_04685 [Saprospiraceae bacterium]
MIKNWQPCSRIYADHGGHDHDNQIHHIGSTVVTKADANAKTVYVTQTQIRQEKRKMHRKFSLSSKWKHRGRASNSSSSGQMGRAFRKNHWLKPASMRPIVVARLDELLLDCREGDKTHTGACW